MNPFDDFEEPESSSDDFVSDFNDPNHHFIINDWLCSPDIGEHHSFNQLIDCQ